jgi:aspartyl/glutamyl-tRNA(Asn/Gln) amidotransferase C subunit
MKSADIERLANLARVSVPKEELDAMTTDITNILGFIDTVQSVSIESRGEAQTDKVNIFREDAVDPIAPAHDLVEAAPLHQDHFVKVPKVIE